MKVKKGDLVLIITGKDKGKSGKIIKSMPKEQRVVVDGLNLRKKHVRPKKQGEKGQTVEIASSMNISNVKLVCGKCGKATRVGYKIDNNNKFRVCKKCGQII